MARGTGSDFKRSIMTRWGYSYLAICIVPILAIITLAVAATILISVSVAATNNLSQFYVTRQLDDKFNDTASICQDILLDPQLNILTTIQDPLSLSAMDYEESVRSLRHIISGYEGFDDVIIFSSKLGIFLSREDWGRLDFYYLSNQDRMLFDYNSFERLFTQERWKLDMVASQSDSDRFCIIRPISFVRSNNPNNFCIAMMTDASKLLPEELVDYQDVVIYNELLDNVLFDFTGRYEKGKDYDELSRLVPGSITRLDNYVVSSALGERYSLKYIVMVDRSTYFYYLNITILLSVFLTLVGIGFGMFVISRLLRSNWKSYEEAIAASGADISQLEGKNAYSPFVSSVAKLKEEKEDMSQILKDQTESLKGHMLSKLVERGGGAISREALRECGIELPYDEFFVLMASVVEGEEERYENLVSSYRSDRYISLPFDSTHGVGFIVNTGINDYRSIAEDLKHLLSDGKDMIIQLGASNISRGLDSLGSDYLEAINVLEYQKNIGSAEFMFYRDVEEMSEKASFQYSMEQELNIQNAIRSGNALEAESLIDSIIEENSRSGVSPRILRYLLFSISGTIVRTVNSLDERFADSIPQITLPPIIQSDSFERSHQEVNEIIKKVCAAIAQIESQYAGSTAETYSIYRKALSFIHENYSNSAMNVSMVADTLGVSIAYLSKIFKKYHSMNISDYITSYRVSVAKRYLAEGGLVNGAVEECGFGSLRTFLRVFKNCEGITPGQYKTMSAREDR